MLPKMASLRLLFIVLIVTVLGFVSAQQLQFVDNNLRVLEEDAYLSCPELISKYGYPVETHEVITEDGYILTLFRIPYGRKSTTKTPNSRPVYVQHGLFSSSDDWIITRPEKGFGYILADAGYDVWLANARGNKWSRRHVIMDADKEPEFWNFSWHEMGIYDLPAVIDHIIATNGAEKLHYVGHSMGSTMFFVMGTMRPEYNDKIRSAHLFAPVAFQGHTKTPLLHALSVAGPGLGLILREVIGKNEILPLMNWTGPFGDKFCSDEALSQIVCTNVIFLICGFDSQEMNTTMLPLIMSHAPSGSSAKNLLHFAQSIKTGHFRQYDYGPNKNKKIYGKYLPPAYDFSNLSAPIALHSSDNDWLAVPKDVLKVQRKLPNLIGKFRVPFKQFNHLDFLWAIHAKELLYDTVIRLMNRF